MIQLDKLLNNLALLILMNLRTICKIELRIYDILYLY